MKILMVACTRSGYDLMKKIENKYCHACPGTEMITRVKCSTMGWEKACADGKTGGMSQNESACAIEKSNEVSEELLREQSISECVAEQFSKVEAIVFIGAVGIAVRSIAPCLVHKSVDPAVVAVDETGKFCISLLSGHFGGANDLAEKIAELIDGIPVVTTATDREQKFSVDVFAKRNGLILEDWEMAKGISAAVLAGEKIGFASRISVEGNVPEELEFADIEAFAQEISCRKADSNRQGILISPLKEEVMPFPMTLQLVPQNVVAGIGCRKGVSKDKIEEAVDDCLNRYGILPQALKAAASIELKKDEAGIADFCACRGLPFVIYTADELRQVPGDFSKSGFVKEVTGVDNVCERSALAGGGKLICPKQVYDKVTVALAVQKESVKF